MNGSVLFHNPACSKSRAALAILIEQGVMPELRDYLSQPPQREEIESLLNLSGMQARELLRSDEPEYNALGLSDPTLSTTQLINAIVAHPRLLQRPILVHGGRAVIARPVERVLELLQST